MSWKGKEEAPWRGLVPPLLILILFLVLAVCYSVATPIFEASDEIWHYPFVQYLADGRGLPVQQSRAEDNVARQEGSQPPLYYALAAAGTFWIDTGDPANLARVNPHAQVGVPLVPDNKNMVIHNAEEDFPYHGVSLAVHLARWLSVLLGAISVVCTYRTAKALFPGQPPLALGAMAFVAFNPMFLFISGSVNNDNLVVTLSAITLFLLIRQLARPLQARDGLWFGLLIGLAALSKLSGLGLLGLFLAVVLWLAWRRRTYCQALYLILITAGVALAVAGWWYWRNWQLYGDPTGLSMMLKIVGLRQPAPGLIDLWPEFEGFRINFWGLFGAVNVLMDGWIYHLFDGLSLAAAAGLIFFLVRRRPAWRDLVPLAIAALWTVIVVVSLLRWTQMTLASQGRLIFPALPAIASLFVLGLSSWLPRRLGPFLMTGMILFWFGLAFSAPSSYIYPAYARPELRPAAAMAEQPGNLEIDYGGFLRLQGYELTTPEVRPGTPLRLTLDWQALASMDRDYSVFVHLFGLDGTPLGQLDTYPGRGTLGTSQWPVGTGLHDYYEVPVSFPIRAGVAVGRIEVGVYDYVSKERLVARDHSGRPLDTTPVVARFVLRGKPVSLPPPAHRTTVRFGEGIELTGYDLESASIAPGQTLDVKLRWRALRQPDKDYTVFVQLIGNGQLLAQEDAQPRGGTFPTSLWSAGEEVEDVHLLPTSAALPPGEYQLIVGLYDVMSGERLPVTGQGAGGDFYQVTAIQIVGL